MVVIKLPRLNRTGPLEACTNCDLPEGEKGWADAPAGSLTLRRSNPAVADAADFRSDLVPSAAALGSPLA